MLTKTLRAGLAHVAAAAVLSASAPSAQEAKIPLTVAFLGDVEARTKDYSEALALRFEKVTVFRHGTPLADLAAADVVVLDWQQKVDEFRKLGADPEARAKACPLGARKDWGKPTVLLGSAGLNLACAWDVKGGFG